MTKHLFLTGASGFVGSAVLRHVLAYTNWRVTAPVTMRHHGEQSRILPLKAKYGDRLTIVPCDLSVPFYARQFPNLGCVDYVWNVASESHVDRSLSDPAPFIRNNVELIINVGEFVREVQPEIFLHMSTDEVFGPLYDDQKPHDEWAPIKPSNPYSASKAAQEAIIYSYWRAYNIPLVITNTMNLIGPMQHPEKFVPKVIRSLTRGEAITIHANEDGESGSRCWIGVEDFANAWHWLTEVLTATPQDLTYYPTMPREPKRFNIVGQHASNLCVARTIAEIMGVEPNIKMVNFHTSRPGHDMHYGLDGSKMRDLGWSAPMNLDDRLIQIVHWYQDHPEFLEA